MQWLDEDFADSCDFELIGVSSPLPPHRLCWEINFALDWNFAFSHLLTVAQKNGQSEHAVYRFQRRTESLTRNIFLVENKIPSGVVARFQGAVELDYLIQLGEDCMPASEVIVLLKGIKSIQYAQLLDPLRSGAIEHLALLDLAEMSS